MTELYSQYTSGTQLSAGALGDSATGASGLNQVVDRLNAITGSDGVLSSGCISIDHGTATTDMVINACYGTSATPPSAATTTEGAIYIQYDA